VPLKATIIELKVRIANLIQMQRVNMHGLWKAAKWSFLGSAGVAVLTTPGVFSSM